MSRALPTPTPPARMLVLAAVLALPLVGGLGGCASDGGQAAVVDRAAAPTSAAGESPLDIAIRDMERGSDGEDAYRGPLVAALVTGSGPTAEVGRRMAGALGGGTVFATVLPVASAAEAHEAEVIIAPSVVDAKLYAGRFEQVTVRVKTWRKGTGATGLDQVYQGRQRGRDDALVEAIAAMKQDLARRYGARVAL